MSWSEIKHAINRTLGTSAFLPLNLLIQYNIDKSNMTDVVEFDTPGNYIIHVPVWANNARITAAGGGGGGCAGFGSGGGGGAGAILESIYTISATLKNTNISIAVGSGGNGGYYTQEDDGSNLLHVGNDGENTIISAFNITLGGGKAGTSNAGGAAGGSGGGAGGRNSNGADGISGSGGTGSSRAGGGGGSLGSGGTGVTSSQSSSTSGGEGSRGGGGGANYNSSTLYSHGGKGGDGYIKIEWLL